MNDEGRLCFTSDYTEGAYPSILEKLFLINYEKNPGYGLDKYSDSACSKIRAAANTPEADIYFISGGTQTNALVIDSVLRPYQGVIASDSGHISVHEAGAIEFGGHKVLTVKGIDGKISAEAIEDLITAYDKDANREHMVMPGMVYISQPTELGTLYSLQELKEISSVCRAHSVPLYLDGARLAYALACPENDVTLPDIGSLCDVFYIGGTKCGALFGEAVVIPRHDMIPHFYTMIKQHGALLAKGWVAGIQFDTLFTDDLYLRIGLPAIREAERIRQALLDKGYELPFPSPTNQIFVLFSKAAAEELSKKVEMSFWENVDEDRLIMRIATSWATKSEDVDRLISVL